MRKLLNTLYIFQDDIYLKLDGLNVVATKGKEIVARVPFCNIESIVCFNYMGCTPMLMSKCAEEGVSLNFLTPNGKFLGRVEGPIKGNVHLRREQFRKFDDKDFCLGLAKCIIITKLQNTANFLAKECRENKSLLAYVDNVLLTLKDSIEKAKNCNDVDTLRGIEGDCARQYFSIFDRLILNKEFTFSFRSKRPPLDAVNALLSYFYTLLALDCQSALETVGLDPYIGCLHTDRAGRPALALDIMEEFRCYLVDRYILSLVNLRQLSSQDFEIDAGGAVTMTDNAKRIVLTEWQNRKKESIMHPILKEKVQVGLLPYIQARLLAKYIRGEQEEYLAFIPKL